MKYIFGKVQADQQVISDLQDLQNEFDIDFRLEIEELPCYYIHMNNLQFLPKDAEIDYNELLQFIVENVSNEWGKDKLLGFSVTTKEHNCKQWLAAAARYPAGRITEVVRTVDAGLDQHTYTCYFITIPVSDTPVV